MKAAIAISMLLGAAILGWSMYLRAFGAYGYTPHAEDAIAFLLVAVAFALLRGESK